MNRLERGEISAHPIVAAAVPVGAALLLLVALSRPHLVNRRSLIFRVRLWRAAAGQVVVVLRGTRVEVDETAMFPSVCTKDKLRPRDPQARQARKPTPGRGAGAQRQPTPALLKYLRVLVDANDPLDGPTKVNVRVPMQLLRAGVQLTGVIPDRARDQVNEACARKASSSTSTSSRPTIWKRYRALRDLTVDVERRREGQGLL